MNKRNYLLSEQVKQINTLEIAKVSSNRTKIPRFGTTISPNKIEDSAELLDLRFARTEQPR